MSMKLSSHARYALQGMLTIYRLAERDGRPVSLQRVSEKTGISRRYLEQLVMPLKKARLLRAFSGRRGG